MKKLLIATCLTALFSNAFASGSKAIWITNVKLVSPEKLDLIEQGSVLVEDGKIIAVDRGGKRRQPAGATRIDGKGYFLTPGLIDSHVHLHGVPGMSMEQPKVLTAMADAYYKQLPRSFLYYGYTTVIDLALADRAIIAGFTSAPLHPDVVHCGEPLVFANGYPMSYFAADQRFDKFQNIIYDPAQALAIPPRFSAQQYTAAAGVARVKEGGGSCVKTHFERGFGRERNLPVMSQAVLADVRAAATRQDLVLVMHANGFEGQQFAVDGKVDVLAHGMWKWEKFERSAELPAEIASLLDTVAERRTGYQATMQVLYGLRALYDPAYLANPGVRKVVPAAMVKWFGTPEGQWFKAEMAEGESDGDVYQGFGAPLARLRQVVAYLARKDANFVFGTDTPSSPTYGNLPGLNGYLEMQHLHEAGLSLAQVFKAATINNARTFKIDHQVGSIEVGKSANLLLMKKSPLADIAAYDSIETVWVRGEQVKREVLSAN
jgi:imidazolonepropionase-like amidohydrolase